MALIRQPTLPDVVSEDPPLMHPCWDKNRQKHYFPQWCSKGGSCYIFCDGKVIDGRGKDLHDYHGSLYDGVYVPCSKRLDSYTMAVGILQDDHNKFGSVGTQDYCCGKRLLISGTNPSLPGKTDTSFIKLTADGLEWYVLI
jgi:hypothetical protein